MSNFYTNVQVVSGNILYRGVLDGKRVKQKIEYSPSLYITTTKKTEFRSLDGESLQRKLFGTIQEARNYIDQFKDVTNGPKRDPRSVRIGKLLIGSKKFVVTGPPACIRYINVQ